MSNCLLDGLRADGGSPDVHDCTFNDNIGYGAQLTTVSIISSYWSGRWLNEG